MVKTRSDIKTYQNRGICSIRTDTKIYHGHGQIHFKEHLAKRFYSIGKYMKIYVGN